MLLATTNGLVQVVTGGTQTTGVYAAWLEINGTTSTPTRLLTQITSMGTTNVVGSPASGVQRKVKSLVVSNEGSSAQVNSVQVVDGTPTTNPAILETMSLGANSVGEVTDGSERLLLLASTSDQLVVTSGGTQALQCHVAWSDYVSGSAPTVSSVTNTPITNTTPVQVVPATPNSSTLRNVKYISISNQGTSSESVTITITDGTTTVTLQTMTLPAGWALNWTSTAGWQWLSNLGTNLNYAMLTAYGVTIGSSSSTATGLTQIPANSNAWMVAVNVTTAYPANTTLRVGYTGATNAFMDDGVANLSSVGVSIFPIFVPIGTSPQNLLATITGSLGSGAGTVALLAGPSNN